MDNGKPVRNEAVRNRVIDAAERLLRHGKAEFSMRDLASEAGVSFATPFNQFGNKAAIMHALSARRIDAMLERFAGTSPGDVRARVMAAVDIAVTVMLEEPAVNRSVMGWLGTATLASGEVLAHSTRLWAVALGHGLESSSDLPHHAPDPLPELLAYGFRGVLSFWTAGEISDQKLRDRARSVAIALLAGSLLKT